MILYDPAFRMPHLGSSNCHTEESMVDQNSVNAQPISECAVKKL